MFFSWTGSEKVTTSRDPGVNDKRTVGDATFLMLENRVVGQTSFPLKIEDLEPK